MPLPRVVVAGCGGLGRTVVAAARAAQVVVARPLLLLLVGAAGAL